MSILKPEYRVQIQIVDEATGHVVTKINEPLYNNFREIFEQAGRAQQTFKDKDKAVYEAENYPLGYSEEVTEF